MTAQAPARRALGANYWKLLAAHAFSNLGDGLRIVAIPWLASAITRDPLLIATATLTVRLPWLLFALPAGVITDRVDRRKLIAWTDVAAGLVMAGFALVVLANQAAMADPEALAAGTAEPPGHQALLLALLYTTALLIGLGEVLRDNAAQTLMPSIVPKERLERANGRMWGAELVMNQLVGPPLAGLLLATALALPFVVNVGTFALAAGLAFALIGSFAPHAQAPSGRIAWRAEIAEGVRWLWRHQLLRTLALLLGVMNGMSMMATAIFVLFAQEILVLDAAGFGLVLTGTAVGGLAGSLLADRVSSRIGPGTALLTSITGLGLALAMIGLVPVAMLAWSMLVVIGFLVVQWNVVTVSLRQTIVPDHLLGRVNSVYRFFGWGMISIGSLLGGVVVTTGELLVAREWALRAPFLLAATVYVILLIYAAPRINTRRIREARAAAE
ncbi:MFS transporter [Haloechinothrix sp. LS1_15]|uniref:MFS transporter n=1 Tax=Haloechinothrix sp. LS1_15 TaxID=2652248 RepID=UPI002946CB73|nr:MFS transporter [Haloechinothrix sp. LS1_15]MDV6014268.1 MFS transporter [Haloechinothrix sp. LS1_15]